MHALISEEGQGGLILVKLCALSALVELGEADVDPKLMLGESRMSTVSGLKLLPVLICFSIQSVGNNKYQFYGQSDSS
jgi:hypothetical protein